MGYLFRYAICECGIVQRVKRGNKPRVCSCGSNDLTIRPNWYIRIGDYQEKVGSEELAKRILRIREGEIASGKFRLKKTKKILVREYALNHFWPLYAERLKSARDYWNRIHQYILPEIGELYLDQINRMDIESMVARWFETNKPATVQNKLNTIKSFFSRAVEWKLIEESPAKGVKIRKFDNRRHDYLSTEEYHLLLDSTDNEMLKAAIIIAVGTGMRAGELFGMEWAWCDFNKKEIRVPAEISKGGESRIIPMIEPVYRVLTEFPHRNLKSNQVFTSPRLGKSYADHMKGTLEKAVQRAGLPDYYGWHIIGRHTFSSWWIEDGGDIYALQKALGHKSIKTTERYAHLAPKHKQIQAEKISHRFQTLGNKLVISANGKNEIGE